jgi:hypothetical protein
MPSYEDHDQTVKELLVRASPLMRKLMLREHALHDQIMSAFRDKNESLAMKLRKKIMQVQSAIMKVATDEARDRKSNSREEKS